MKIKEFFLRSQFILSLVLSLFFLLVVIQSYKMKSGLSVFIVCFAIFLVLVFVSFVLYKASFKRIKKNKCKYQLEFNFIEFYNPTNTLMYPTIKDSIISLVVFVGLQVYLSFLCISFASNSVSNINIVVLTAFVNFVSISSICLYFKSKNGASIKKIVSLFSFSIVPFFCILIVFIFYSYFLILLESFIEVNVPIPNFFKALFDEFYQPNHRLSAFIALVLVAPVTEELLFRGIFFRSFLNKYSLRKSAVISSLLFGLIHLNPIQFIIAVPIGIFFCFTNYKLKSLFPSIILHALYNFFCLALGIGLLRLPDSIMINFSILLLSILPCFFLIKEYNRTTAST